MNKFITSMKNTIKNYYKAATEAAEKKDKNNSTYLAGIAAEENAKLDSFIQSQYAKSINEIDGILEAAKADSEKWSVLDGKKIDSADLELLRGGFNLGYKELSELVEKHSNNATMLNAISEYASNHNVNGLFIPTVYSKNEAYTKLALSASQLCSSIYAAYNDSHEVLNNLISGGLLETGVLTWGDNLSIEISKALSE
jgi:cell division protein YceG involved in septum cleavage